MSGQIRVGVGGWTYEPWRGTFYPAELAHKREQWERKRTEAERALQELPDRRRQAMDADAEQLPSGEGLQATVAEAKERIDYFRDVAARKLDAEEHAIVDADLAFFDRLDVEAIQKAGAALEQAAEGITTAEGAIRAARGTHSTVRLARIRRGEGPPQEMLAVDFASAVLEINEARRVMGRYEQIMLAYRERRAVPSGRQKLTNAEVRTRFGGVDERGGPTPPAPRL